MPIKWRVFYWLNFTLGIPTFFTLIFAAASVKGSLGTTEDIIATLIALFSLLMILFNCGMNIYIVQRYFPDILMSIAARRVQITSFVINIIICLGLAVICFFAGREAFFRPYSHNNTSGIVTFFIIFVIWFVHFVILIGQSATFNYLKKNHQASVDMLIEAIGEDESKLHRFPR